MSALETAHVVEGEVPAMYAVDREVFPTTNANAAPTPEEHQRTQPTTTEGFDADELKMALEASTKETSADLLEIELEYETRAAQTTRTKGRTLASRFWVSQCLDADETLDASCDGFYDVWGDTFEGSADGKLPELVDLLRTPPKTASDEVILVDRSSDMFLESLDALAADECATAPNVRAKCALLARFVSDRLGGSVKTVDDAALAEAYANEREHLLAESRGCVLHVGHLSRGQERHRAILFKALASTVGVPCRLVRGEYYCGRDTACVMLTTEDTESWVDLMICPGKLIKASESPAAMFDDVIPATPPPYDPSKRVGAIWRSRDDKGKTPLSSGKSPLFSMFDDTSDSSIEDLVAFASAGARQTTPATTSTSAAASRRPCEDEPVIDESAEMMSAIAVAHGVSKKSAATAVALTEDDLEKANYLCNALATVMEDEARLNKQGSYTESILLQEMFNLLVTHKWIVSDAVDAFRTRRLEEIELASVVDDANVFLEAPPHVTAEERRAELKAKAAEDLAKATENRVEKLREEQRASSEQALNAEAIRQEFRAEWAPKVASMNLAQTLAAFGVKVDGGEHANAKQLRSAYRKAILKFHPDRQVDKDLTEKIGAEERFKLIREKMQES